ncbi:hypothetical protein V498_10245 [Pseudogymnoascus sp. VKM F-4517 (FW-2822)]|nr:hypothetical protein V498_10245 [Pseudogymnoascus sp. VKM F-4517 (FW-2822)]
MGEKLTDAAAQTLLALLRSDSSVDSKVASLTTAKSSIKQHNLPDACVGPLVHDAESPVDEDDEAGAEGYCEGDQGDAAVGAGEGGGCEGEV